MEWVELGYLKCFGLGWKLPGLASPAGIANLLWVSMSGSRRMEEPIDRCSQDIERTEKVANWPGFEGKDLPEAGFEDKSGKADSGDRMVADLLSAAKTHPLCDVASCVQPTLVADSFRGGKFNAATSAVIAHCLNSRFSAYFARSKKKIGARVHGVCCMCAGCYVLCVCAMCLSDWTGISRNSVPQH